MSPSRVPLLIVCIKYCDIALQVTWGHQRDLLLPNNWLAHYPLFVAILLYKVQHNKYSTHKKTRLYLLNLQIYHSGNSTTQSMACFSTWEKKSFVIRVGVWKTLCHSRLSFIILGKLINISRPQVFFFFFLTDKNQSSSIPLQDPVRINKLSETVTILNKGDGTVHALNKCFCPFAGYCILP